MDKKSVNRLVLRLSRIAEGKRQDALAKEIGRSQAWLSRVECGERGSVVTDRDIAKLSTVLGVDRSDLEGK